MALAADIWVNLGGIVFIGGITGTLLTLFFRSTGRRLDKLEGSVGEWNNNLSRKVEASEKEQEIRCRDRAIDCAHGISERRQEVREQRIEDHKRINTHSHVLTAMKVQVAALIEWRRSVEKELQHGRERFRKVDESLERVCSELHTVAEKMAEVLVRVAKSKENPK